MAATTEEYKLLERMNLVTKANYAEMTTHAAGLVQSMQALQEKCTHSSFLTFSHVIHNDGIER